MLSQIIVFVINKYILFCHGWQYLVMMWDEVSGSTGTLQFMICLRLPNHQITTLHVHVDKIFLTTVVRFFFSVRKII
jgi:hypothetical protein